MPRQDKSRAASKSRAHIVPTEQTAGPKGMLKRPVQQRGQALPPVGKSVKKRHEQGEN